MIKLRIKTAGHTISIPGIPTFRTPVEIDITKLDERFISIFLKSQGIEDYEIISQDNDKEERVIRKISPLKKKDKKLDVIPNLNDEKMDRIETLLTNLINTVSENKENKEQINNKLERLENIVDKILDVKISPVISTSETKTIKHKKDDEEVESYIPTIDTSGMKMKSENVKTIKQDSSDINDVADLLSSLTKK